MPVNGGTHHAVNVHLIRVHHFASVSIKGLDSPAGIARHNPMDISKLWLTYCEERLGRQPDPEHVEHLGPWQCLELLWWWVPVISQRDSAIMTTAYNPAFDDEADNGLMLVCFDNGFDRLDEVMSLGGWRVLRERLAYALVTMAVQEYNGAGNISMLPLGLEPHDRAVALGLAFLGGPAKTIDRKLLPPSAPGTLPAFPGLSLRKQ